MKKIYIGNLPFDTTREQLESLFAEYGDIDEVYLVRDRKTRRTKGYGFVTFTGADQAQSALTLDGEQFNGRNLRVSIAKEKDADDATQVKGGQGTKARSSNWFLMLISALVVSFAVSYYMSVNQERNIEQASRAQLSSVQHHLQRVDQQLAKLEKQDHVVV